MKNTKLMDGEMEAVAAVERLDDAEALARIASVDSYFIAARVAAVKKIRDDATLLRVALEAHEGLIREIAIRRLSDNALRGVVTRIALCDPWYAARLAAVQRCDDQATLARVALSDPNGDIRATAVEILRDQATVRRIAESDPDFRVRIAAKRRIRILGGGGFLLLGDRDFFVAEEEGFLGGSK